MTDFKIGDEVVFIADGKRYLVIDPEADDMGHVGCRNQTDLLLAFPGEITKTGRQFYRMDVWSNYNKLIQPQVPEDHTPEIDMSMYTGGYQNE